jgi:DNA (cytosine-5)-methyltransferase 1
MSELSQEMPSLERHSEDCGEAWLGSGEPVMGLVVFPGLLLPHCHLPFLDKHLFTTFVLKMKKLTCIDLFAGCGGLSTGLHIAGFKTLLYSELNKDASATYRANHPEAAAEGDVHKLTAKNGAHLKSYLKVWKGQGIETIDLVCGGPPCQGYSGIGHRRTFKLDKEEIPSNHLFEQMVKVVELVQPKIFLFENVAGLLSARWTPEGTKGEIFRDVIGKRIGFGKLKNYDIRWDLVHAKDYGVPQNRPRVLIVGINMDYLESPSSEPAALDPKSVIAATAVKQGWLPEATHNAPDLVDLLSDLAGGRGRKEGVDVTYWSEPKSPIQVWLRTKGGKLLGKGDLLTEQEYSNHKPKVVEKFEYMLKHGEIHPDHKTKKFAQRVLPKRWGKGGPSITATSLADDYVHFSEPRTLTVREWARLQTFPDWYVFKGPRTTGGRRRAGDPSKGDWSRDVPRYTQIGNAVPVLLAKALGLHFSSLIRNNEKKKSKR